MGFRLATGLGLSGALINSLGCTSSTGLPLSSRGMGEEFLDHFLFGDAQFRFAAGTQDLRGGIFTGRSACTFHDAALWHDLAGGGTRIFRFQTPDSVLAPLPSHEQDLLRNGQ